MNYQTITKAIAETVMDGWIRNNNVVQQQALNPDYEDLRKKIFTAHKNMPAVTKEKPYQYDLFFALDLYMILTDDPDFSLRIASNDAFWYHLTMVVIPEIVLDRWEINQTERFYSQSNRIWLKTLFCYIHLSWQGDRDSTFEVLNQNSTDTIVQLTERPSSKGYSIELFRTIMKRLQILNQESEKSSTDNFRRIMKLNTAYIKTTDPELYAGGLIAYVDWLFDKIER